MTLLLKTGARVSSVNEEGEVSLFCYSLHRTISLPLGEPKMWASRIGDFVTLTVTDEKHETPQTTGQGKPA